MSSDGADSAHFVPAAVTDTAHPIPLGTTVTVFRLPKVAPPFIEGRAIIHGFAPGRHLYEVRFLGDPVGRIRVVHRECQEDLDRVLAMMVEIWWAEAALAADFDEFFLVDD